MLFASSWGSRGLCYVCPVQEEECETAYTKETTFEGPLAPCVVGALENEEEEGCEGEAQDKRREQKGFDVGNGKR